MGRYFWIHAVVWALSLATGVSATRAGAQTLDLEELAAALAVPVITGGQAPSPVQGTRGDVVLPNPSAVTLVTVSNGRSSSIILRLEVIDGDPGPGTWSSLSFECELTGLETTTFVFRNGGGGSSEVYVECSDGTDTEGDPVAFFSGAQNGILFISVADPLSGITISQNVIFGDAVVVDPVGGRAWSFGAIPFQAGQGQNNGDQVHRFDGLEYARFPQVLAANFLAPTASGVEAELVLFTLDGTTGSTPQPRVKLGGLAFNDDEEFFDFQYVFDGFDIVALDDVNANLAYTGGLLGLGSMSGHIEVVPLPIATAGIDAHDAAYGDANSVRTRPFHGWLVQGVPAGATLVGGGDPIAARTGAIGSGVSASAWARPLSQSRMVMVPFQADGDPVLDADVLH